MRCCNASRACVSYTGQQNAADASFELCMYISCKGSTCLDMCKHDHEDRSGCVTLCWSADSCSEQVQPYIAQSPAKAIRVLQP